MRPQLLHALHTVLAQIFRQSINAIFTADLAFAECRMDSK